MKITGHGLNLILIFILFVLRDSEATDFLMCCTKDPQVARNKLTAVPVVCLKQSAAHKAGKFQRKYLSAANSFNSCRKSSGNSCQLPLTAVIGSLRQLLNASVRPSLS